MKTVWKFPLRITDEQTVEMPAGATILHVAEQSGILCLWALLDPGGSPEDRKIRIIGTGHPIEDRVKSWEQVEAGCLNYLGTAVCTNGSLVWHVFEDLS